VKILPDLHARLKALGPSVRPVTVTLDDPGREKAAIDFLHQHDALKDAYLAVPEQEARLAIPQRLGQDWTDLVVPAVLIYDQDGQLAHEYLDATEGAVIAERVAGLINHGETLHHADE
ncbi:MAG: hypothetical protein R3336_07370, partial [Phycisphaeraceae bacterium]|nr:hypothetical protein [Phycisphaeraceae bacterium]